MQPTTLDSPVESEVHDFEWDLGETETDERDFPVLICTDYM